MRIAQALAKSAAGREGMPEHHNRQVAELSAAVAEALGLGEEIVLRARLAGWLHDVGKVAIPEAILSKPEKLTEAEWTIMRTHAALGQEIVTRIADLAPAGLPSATTTSASTAPAIPTPWPARRSRSRRGSWPSPTPSRP